MSINLVRAIDPRIDVLSADRRKYKVFDGPVDVGYVRVFPDGGVSNSSMTFTANPPSSRVFVNRRPILTMKFRLTFTGDGGVQRILQCSALPSAPGINPGTSKRDAPRCHGLLQAIQSLQVSLNNDRLAQNLNQYSRVFQRYNRNPEVEDIDFGMSPSMPDQSQEYADLDMSARSELVGYADNVTQLPRGGFVGALVTRNDLGNGQATVELEMSEFLNISPFSWEQKEQNTGFIGLQNMAITVSLGGRGVGIFSGLAAALWSHSTASTTNFTGITADVLSAYMSFSYMSPDTHMSIPRMNMYPYNELVVYPTQTVAPVLPAQSVVLTMNTIQLNSIPSRIFVFASPVDSAFSFNSTDTYFGLTNINISFDNRDSILANATELDLYQIAVKNRVNLSWTQWKKYVGGPIALDFGEDIPIRSGESVGLRGSYNLRLQGTFVNLKSTTQTPTLTVLVVSEGIMSIIDGNVTRNIGVLSQSDLKEVNSLESTVYEHSGSVYGGKINWEKVLDTGKKFLKSAVSVGEKVLPVLMPEQAGLIKNVADFAHSKGYGMVGGSRMTRKQLLDRLSS